MDTHNYQNIKIKVLDNRLGNEIPLPSYATAGSAGLDLRACVDGPLLLEPGESKLIKTGMAIYIENPRYAGVILPRSGLGHRDGIILGNGLGLIDADYQGELLISCWNRSHKNFTLNVGDRLAQLVLLEVAHIQWQFVDDFAPTERGEGGFGHTEIN